MNQMSLAQSCELGTDRDDHRNRKSNSSSSSSHTARPSAIANCHRSHACTHDHACTYTVIFRSRFDINCNCNSLTGTIKLLKACKQTFLTHAIACTRTCLAKLSRVA